MPKDLTVIVRNQPGALAKMGETLGKAGVNIEGICGVTVGDRGIIHVLVEDATKAGLALEENGFPVPEETEVLLLNVMEDRPGQLGSIARQLADAGVNIYLAYLATSTRLVLSVSNLEKARAVLQPQ